MNVEPRIVYVCSWCLREYDLIEDLRGHMVFFHGCQPLTDTVSPHQQGLKEQNVKGTESTTKGQTPSPHSTSPPTPSSPPPASATDLQPLPYKDFRILLRVNMRIPCSASNSCIYKFENVQKMALHVKCHKDNEINCSECGNKFANWRRCSVHLWRTHQIDVDLLRCPTAGCSYKSPVAALVWRHMRVHRKWRVRVMRREMLRRRAQKQRQNEATETQPSQLLQPLQQQQQQQQLQQQPQLALPKKNKYYAEKTCEICQRKFVNGKTLSKHVKTVHNKIKPFICSVCGKKTARKACLIIHMRQHTGEKPLKCEHCKFSTRDPSSLYKHRQRHGKGATAFSAEQDQESTNYFKDRTGNPRKSSE